MRNTFPALWTVISVFALCVTQSAIAATASTQENIGVGTGAIVGAVAGGPVGFIIGAALGAKIGDNFHRKGEEIDELQTSLEGSRIDVTELQANLGDLNTEVSRLQNASHPELVSLMQAGIDMDLLFRTDEFALTDATGDRLVQMATSLSNMTQVQVQLDGFADERGAADYNLQLSEKRVEYVRDLLIDSGIHPTRIRVTAHGESVAQDDNIDSLALERRVGVRLFIDNTHTVAANPR